MYKQIDRPNKEKLVRAFFSTCPPLKTYLCLPSLNCRDILIGMETGKITKKTKILAIERDYGICMTIKAKLRSLGLKHVVHHGELETSHFTDVIDAAYIDVCGQITADVAFWLASLSFNDNARLAFTFSKPPRSHSTFYQRLLNQSYGKYARFIGPHHDNDLKHKSVCGLISYFLPIKWNVTKTYKDTKTPMMFLMGYFGKAPTIVMKEKKKPGLPKIELRIKELAEEGGKNNVAAQRIGGFKIMWNRLTPGEKMGLRKRFKKELAAINV